MNTCEVNGTVTLNGVLNNNVLIDVTKSFPVNRSNCSAEGRKRELTH